jgi:hypothetical protein
MRSVANRMRLDAREILAQAARTGMPARPYRLANTNHTLGDLRAPALSMAHQC